MKIQAVLILLLTYHSLALEYRMLHDRTKIPQTNEEWLIFGISFGVMAVIFITFFCLIKRQERLERQAANQANAQLQPQPQNPTNPNAQGMSPPFSAAPPQFHKNFNRPNPAPFNPYNQPMNPYTANPTGPQRF